MCLPFNKAKGEHNNTTDWLLLSNDKNVFVPGTSESGFLKFEKWKVKIKSFHSFSRSAKWKKKWLSLFFEKCKVKSKYFHSFREVKSEIKMLRDRDREVKILENSEQFSRNEIFEQVGTSLWWNLAPNKVEELTIVNENEEKATCFKQNSQYK